MRSGEKWLRGPLPRRPALHNGPGQRFGAKLTERIERARQRQALGRPLATVIHTAHAATPGRGTSYMAARLAIAAGIVGSLFAIIQGSLITAVVAFSAILAGGTWLSLAYRRKDLPEALGANLTRDAAELDTFLSRVSPQLPDDAVRILAEIKSSMQRVVETLANERYAATVAPEELFFVHQALTRYLPDACRHYLSVIDASRGIDLTLDEKAAETLLHEQFTVIYGRLRGILTSAANESAQTLINHTAFIKTKRKPLPPFQETLPK